MGLSQANLAMLEVASVRGRRLDELALSTPSEALFQRVIDRRTSIEIVQRACEVYAERPALGWRVRGTRRFETLDYRTLWQRIGAFASGLGAEAGTMTVLIGFATVEHVIAELACHYLAAVSIPLAKEVRAQEVVAIAAQTKCRVVVCSAGQLGVAIDALPRCPTVEKLVVIDAHPDDAARARAALPHLAVATTAELERRGREEFVPPRIPEDGTDPLLSLVYTSGSTGSPKGAMFRERSWRARWSTLPTLALASLPMVSVVFLPPNHMGGRNAVANSLKVGGLAYFTAESDMSTLFEDIAIVRPTYIHLVPRLSELVYQHYEREVAGGRAPDEVVAAMRAGFLGDRMLLALTASAPTPRHILDFVRRTFEIPVIDIFAGTEYGHLLTDGSINHQNVRAFQLESVPELGYTVDDVPYPRGELLVKTARGIDSYFENEQATKSLVGEDGFLRTGDIFEQRGPDELVWIGRRNNVLKLAQGEFVNLSRLEAAFATSPLVRQVFLHGESRRADLVGVVVPAPGVTTEAVFAEIRRIASEQALAPYEIPRDLVIDHAPFTRENGLLTSVGKPSRPALLAKYRGALEACYARAVVDPSLPLAERIRATIAARLGRVDPGRSLRGNGGDSLAATELCTAIEAAGGARLSPGFVLGSETTLDDVIAAASAVRAGVTFEEIHGEAPELRAHDLRLDRFFTPVAAPPAATTHHTLLTGATGFLGRFLCRALLARGERVTCIVRAKTDEEARQRLARVGVDPDRLQVVAGDLEQPALGLARDRYDALAGEIDTVVHAAALVNHALDYRALFSANVGATAEIIRFALARQRKRFAYVSTNAVSLALLGARERAYETDDTRALGDRWRIDAERHANGYQASKWAGEILARDLAERFGGEVAVLRCNLVMPALGDVATDDFLTRLVARVIETGVYPRSFYDDPAAAHLDGFPADFLAAAIAAIASERHGFDVYHLNNIHRDDGISLDTLVRRLVARGYPVAQIEDHAAWFAAFARGGAPVEARWRTPLRTRQRRAIDASRFRDAVRAHRPLGQGDIPHLDIAYLDRCLADMHARGLVPPPGAR